MTRETKVGLLVGMGIILLIGIVVSDHLSKVQQQQPANFTDLGRATFDSLTTRQNHALPTGVPVANAARQTLQQRNAPIPMVNEIPAAPAPGSSNFRASQSSRYQLPQNNNTNQLRTIEPSQIPNAQPPIEVRQPRRIKDMSEEQAVAINTRSRPIPPMASVLTPRPRPRNWDWNPNIQNIPSPRQAVAGIEHVVKPGENLYDIANKYYSNGNDWRIIRDANPRLITSAGSIMQGTTIRIPSKQVLRQQKNNPNASSQSTPRQIIVKPGQTLSELAKIHLGNVADWDQLLKANEDQISRPEQLRAGMTLRLPAKTSLKKQAANHQTAASAMTGRTYTIQSGDTLSGIAATKLGHANKWYKLYQYNKSAIKDPDNLRVGTTIKIPN